MNSCPKSAKATAVLAVGLTILLLNGCGSPEVPPQPTPPLPTAEPATPTQSVTPTKAPVPAPTLGNASRGEDLFLANCAPCHGRDANGADYAPSLIHPFVAAKGDAELRETILNGRGGSMPAWRDKLSREEIGDILAYLRSQQQ